MLSPAGRGIRGNSHMIMQDRNHLQIADLILTWIDIARQQAERAEVAICARGTVGQMEDNIRAVMNFKKMTSEECVERCASAPSPARVSTRAPRWSTGRRRSSPGTPAGRGVARGRTRGGTACGARRASRRRRRDDEPAGPEGPAPRTTRGA